MFSVFDGDILTAAGGGFIFFLLFNWLGLRSVGRTSVIRWVVAACAVGALLGIFGNLVLESMHRESYRSLAGGGTLVCLTVTVILYGLASFIYVACVLGAYESSIRLRLVRELHKTYPEGRSLADLFRDYNPAMILNIRLERLTGAGEVVKSGESYRLGAGRSIFLPMNGLVKVLQKLIGGSGS